MRVMLLFNLNVEACWANGTRARLLPTNSWTSKPQPLRRIFSTGRFFAEQVHLSDAQKYRDFNVVVVKDQESTLAKKARYSSFDIQSVPAQSDVGLYQRTAWRQVQLMLAYALSGHKSQGLTMYLTYISLTKSFGFGLPYTLCTRTPYRHNIWFVGVPPRDIFLLLVATDSEGKTLVDRKREELQAMLLRPGAVRAELQQRIDAGEFDLEQLARERGGRAPDCPR